MVVRNEIASFAALGALPSSDADEAIIAEYQQRLEAIEAPISDDEAAVLLKSFGPDDCYGLAWTLLHLIESAPAGPPLASEPGEGSNEWLIRLWARSHRETGRLGSGEPGTGNPGRGSPEPRQSPERG